jgi:putative hydrolase of the HAD superfamily
VRVVLVDLDDTLFDHDRATRESLRAIQADGLAFGGWTLDELDRRHRVVLEVLHLDFLAGRMSGDEARVARFQQLLEAAGASDAAARAPEVARHYRRVYEQSWHCVPGAPELLRAIRATRRLVVVVTNNHLAEQEQKLARLALRPFVDELVTSEEAGCCKPEPEIFRQALARAGAAAGDAVMLGDAWATDIEGAKAAGVRPVWLNRFGHPCPDPGVAQLNSLEPCEVALRVLEG